MSPSTTLAAFAAVIACQAQPPPASSIEDALARAKKQNRSQLSDYKSNSVNWLWHWPCGIV